MKYLILALIFISQNCYAQQDLIGLAFISSNKGNCDEALSYAKSSQNQTLQKIIITRAILDEKCNQMKFDDATNFIYQHPNWSQVASIKKRVESLITKNTDKTKVFNWFSKNSPQTPNGFKYYAIVAPTILGPSPKAQDTIKQGWIYGSFTPQEQSDFLKKYSKFLHQNDHKERIENLLWQNNTQEAKEILELIDKKHRQIYLTRIAIIDQDPKLERMFHALPRHEKLTSGILYSYLKYKKSLKKPVTHEELNLSLHIPDNKENADKWWEVRSYYTRELMDLRRYREAYKLAVNHNCKDKTNITQAEWLSGWIALSFLHKPKIALNHFKVLYQNSGRPISLARGAYWIARTHKAVRNIKEANEWFQEAAKYGHTFYGQMAQIELNNKDLRLQKPITLSDEKIQNILSQEGPKTIDLLLKYNQDHLAFAYIKNLFSMSKDQEYIRGIVSLLDNFNNTSFKVNVAREAALYGVFCKEYGYPAPYSIKNLGVEMPLIYSIIRQESSFEQGVIDPTDGRGLMQLLPSTAKKMAKELGLAYNEDMLLKSAEYNIKLGSKHIADHISYYGGSYVLGIPAYNAGTHRVDKWIVKNGDPRKMKHLYQILDWIEAIPFVTTRDYVHRILENLQVYRSIVNNDSTLNIVKDLMQNKKGNANVKTANRKPSSKV